MTKELEKRFKEVGSQETAKDPIVVAKYFNPTGPGNWYCTEYDPKTKMFFGYCSLFGDENDEWGCVSLRELEEFKGAMGLGIERDLYCGEKPLSFHNVKSLQK